MTLVYSFPPIVSPNSKALILGSMPGEASLKAGEYYAHPRNAFWPIMGELFGAHRTLPYQQRVAIITSAGIALWDSVKACVRHGSLDSSISNEIANDFASFFATYPNISHVFFNGGKAERAFRQHVAPPLAESQRMFTRLPSTSPAHAGMSLQKKLAVWRVVQKVCGRG